MAAAEKDFVVRFPRRFSFVGLLVVIAVLALTIAMMLPSFVITLDVENATPQMVTVSVVRVGTNEAAACTLRPGEKKHLKLFSGDGRDPETWIYLGTVIDPSGDILQTRQMIWREFKGTPWRIVPTAASAPKL